MILEIKANTEVCNQTYKHAYNLFENNFYFLDQLISVVNFYFDIYLLHYTWVEKLDPVSIMRTLGNLIK